MVPRQTIPLAEKLFGYELTTPVATVLFGNRNATLEQLKLAYPHLQWSLLKQTHGDQMIEAQPSFQGEKRPEADAQWTIQENLGLCISTADCIPVFLFGVSSRKIHIAGIHAGWRGVANGLTIKCVNQFLKNGVHPESFSVLIGPHIQKFSFEVGSDVFDQLCASLPKTSHLKVEEFTHFLSIGKYLVDLNLLLKEQLKSTGISDEQISCLMIDTKTDIRFHSHRRDKSASGRQLSFICLNPPI